MLIEYKNVNIYQQGKLVLEGVDFHVDEGEFIYIIGKVGSGKSSLLKTTYCELDLMKDEAENNIPRLPVVARPHGLRQPGIRA